MWLLVKYVRRDEDPSMVRLVSANHDYDDIEVRRSDIEGLYPRMTAAERRARLAATTDYSNQSYMSN